MEVNIDELKNSLKILLLHLKNSSVKFVENILRLSVSVRFATDKHVGFVFIFLSMIYLCLFTELAGFRPDC